LQGMGETVEFELWRSGGEPRPLVLLVPILAGGADLLENVGRRLQARGFDIAFCGRAGSALKPPQRGPELEELLRRTVLHQRLLLAWLRGPSNPPPRGTFVLGMSLGGMVATAVAALEPDLDGLAICLSGGDLPTLVPNSQEGRVEAWVKWRREADGVGTDHLQWELRRELALEPVAMAASIETAKVLFVSAWFDAVIPQHNQDLLWEALGRPARLTVPLGHYTAALAIDPILSAAADHFTGRIPALGAPAR
jgi:pimeloyl-ACP methyl ester carboxylesterase